jgi:glutaminyl-tRNA synthetase
MLEAVNNPEDPAAGTRKVPFSRELLHRARRLHGRPAQEVLPPGPGREVRLRYAYFVTCTGVVKDAAGDITEAALHLRPRHPRRRRPRRPQGHVQPGIIHTPRPAICGSSAPGW